MFDRWYAFSEFSDNFYTVVAYDASFFQKALTRSREHCRQTFEAVYRMPSSHGCLAHTLPT